MGAPVSSLLSFLSIEARVPFTGYRIAEFCLSGAIDPRFDLSLQ